MSDPYNHYLYSRIIEFTGILPYERKAVPITEKPETLPERPEFSLRNMIKKAVIAISGIVPDSLKTIVFMSPGLDRMDQIAIQLALRQFPFLFTPEVKAPESALDFKKRKEISLTFYDDDFMKILNSLIPEQIPQSYIESYGYLREEALKKFPAKPSIIFTANAHYKNEGFKVWAASCAEEGSLLAGTQHGGFEGMGRWFSLEDHQRSIWDKYYSWGWDDPLEGKIKSLPAARLNRAKSLKGDKSGRILMVNTAFIRYSYYMQSMPVAMSGYNAYLKNIFSFIKLLGKDARQLLTVRLYPHDLSCDEKQRFADELPDIDCYRGKKSFYEQLSESRLLIGNNNGTTYLEAFAAGIPTVLFWDPAYWELRETAKPYFDELHRTGILHYTPESCAELVNNIYKDPVAWWAQDDVQKAKDRFCHRFARTSDGWLKEWRQELAALIPQRVPAW
ncbi:MAG: hypothetical protein A2X55_04690 [Nitrospirae bacterium GWB2_47_37]|nr:MAG: hypothetical protein A2X55_04690 [Nitrospirae bacterium GWB2_47_37]